MQIGLTDEEMKILKELQELPFLPDEDCPENTDGQLEEAVEERKRRKAGQKKERIL